ncbi:MAG: threonine--tRNA ligase [Candidatus Thermofonsia Clade 1 bacterium]|uniref:Threonine--tRNA ligase n=1 Tax=Candidatus Thermofonsia Clade 1 bacterium TaxID=2364210 RepID=A0A2M8PGA1_9CHLR|nr:MAG: threonine--tRNA ligase [Candidatus Thermofonsia Clade 1 bacterium]RMF52755.1 MAG: threonine--tRNA ligase [Chloroflexota bacterium]
MSERYEESQLYRIRHSLAHVMAQAVLELFPEGRIAIGPPIEDGFYYDFELPRQLTEADLAEIEARMRRIISGNFPFIRREVTAEEARRLFANQPYKLELIDGLERGGYDENGNKIAEPPVISTYRQDTFEDLCRGPHVAHTGELNPDAFKLMSIAGAYWRGDSRRPQLQRIYGTAWQSAAELEEYLHQLEQAKARDHRKLGEHLGLFTFSPLVGKGLPLWKPKGAILRDILERFLRAEQLRAGYQPVVSPHIAKVDLYRTSGHYPYYADSQFPPMTLDDEEFMLKPMNCPHHIEIYRSEPRSYRDLPLRFAEFGTVYRYEQSGELTGLTRVRGFTQDDAHIFATPEQLEDEFIGVVRLIQRIFDLMGFHDFRARIGTRDPNSDKYVGAPELWQKATQAIINAADKLGLRYFVAEGEAAFYGPKLDFIFRDVLKREWQLGTVQVDYNLPERFGLEYMGEDNQVHRPVMIHRAPFGSMERFVAILIEHFGGAFPVWLAPIQARLIPVADRHVPYLRQVAAKLTEAGLRADVDDGKERMNAKIRKAQGEKIPYMLIAGDRDVASGAISVRLRSGEDLGGMPVEAFIRKACLINESRSQQLMPEQA